MDSSTITAPDLAALQAGPEPPLVVDVLSPASYAAEHLPRAANACVYEMAFGERIRELTEGDPNRSIVVYGLGEGLGAAERARELLARGGHVRVAVLGGGLKGWKDAGYQVETGSGDPAEADSIARIADGRHAIDTKRSSIEWFGRNVGGGHHGTVALASGTLTIRDGLPVDGGFIIDLRSIRCADLGDPALNRLLIRHLESDDFFDVEHHPEASFTLTRSQFIGPRLPGLPNVAVEGMLTLRGVTAPLGFNAVVGRAYDGATVAQAQFDLDRTIWNVRYGSSRFFERLGSHLVNDLVSLHLRMVLAVDAPDLPESDANGK